MSTTWAGCAALLVFRGVTLGVKVGGTSLSLAGRWCKRFFFGSEGVNFFLYYS